MTASVVAGVSDPGYSATAPKPPSGYFRKMVLEPVMHSYRLLNGGPKARRQASPGQRPGLDGKNILALKGRNILGGALSGLARDRLAFPGRCPGLACLRTFGAHAWSTEKVHDRL